jgi:hypothetical protein
MNNQLIPFKFETHAVRTMVIDETPWWVGRDVCNALGYKTPQRAIHAHCKGVPKWSPLQTEGGSQKLRIINISREAVNQPCLFDDEPTESFGGPLEAPRGYDGGAL